MAPHRVAVLLDYNTFAQLEQSEIQSLKREMEQVAADHITNRRYTTESPLTLSILTTLWWRLRWFGRFCTTRQYGQG